MPSPAELPDLAETKEILDVRVRKAAELDARKERSARRFSQPQTLSTCGLCGGQAEALPKVAHKFQSFGVGIAAVTGEDANGRFVSWPVCSTCTSDARPFADKRAAVVDWRLAAAARILGIDPMTPTGRALWTQVANDGLNFWPDTGQAVRTPPPVVIPPFHSTPAAAGGPDLYRPAAPWAHVPADVVLRLRQAAGAVRFAGPATPVEPSATCSACALGFDANPGAKRCPECSAIHGAYGDQLSVADVRLAGLVGIPETHPLVVGLLRRLGVHRPSGQASVPFALDDAALAEMRVWSAMALPMFEDRGEVPLFPVRKAAPRG